MTDDEIEVIFGVMDALGLSRQWEQVIEGKISPNEFGQKLIDIVIEDAEAIRRGELGQ